MTATVNFHEAKTRLSRLVDQAAKGQDLWLPRQASRWCGWSRSTPCRAVSRRVGPLRTLGFLAGQGVVAADVKKAFASDIEMMFNAPR